MASGYALPNGNHHHAHSHSYSYTKPHLSPDKHFSNAFPTRDGRFVKKAGSSGNLYTHTEASRETSPLASPSLYTYDSAQSREWPTPQPIHQNGFAGNTESHAGLPAYVNPSVAMKGRIRGESDLGRPHKTINGARQSQHSSTFSASAERGAAAAALAGALIALPYLLVSTAYFYHVRDLHDSATNTAHTGAVFHEPFAVFGACSLTSATLLLVGLTAKLRFDNGSSSVLESYDTSKAKPTAFGMVSSIQAVFLRILTVGLPLYSAMCLGGVRVGLILIILQSANLQRLDSQVGSITSSWLRTLSTNRASAVVIAAMCLTDSLGLTAETSTTVLAKGYLVLAASVFAIQRPNTGPSSRPTSGSMSKAFSPAITTASRHQQLLHRGTSALWSSPRDVDLTLAAGVLSFLGTFCLTLMQPTLLNLKWETIAFAGLSIVAFSCSLLFARPSLLRVGNSAGPAAGCLVVASGVILSPVLFWSSTACNIGLAALSFLGIKFDSTRSAQVYAVDHGNGHLHHAHSHHKHQHEQPAGGSSFLTKFLLARCEQGSLMYSVLSEKDSRRIAYFTT